MDLQQQKYANTLTVLAKETEDKNVFHVLWRCGIQKQGTVTITLAMDNDIGDKLAIAELSVMQYIIDELEVIGRVPPLKGILFTFSAGAIKKIHTQKSTKWHLYPYAYFLTTRFQNTTVNIDSDESWVLPRAHMNQTNLQLPEPLGLFVYMSTIGKVAVTRHVFEQFKQRMNNISSSEAWKLLNSIISRASFVPLQNKIDDEFDGRNSKKIFDEKSKWCFVLVNLDTQVAIATAY